MMRMIQLMIMMSSDDDDDNDDCVGSGGVEVTLIRHKNQRQKRHSKSSRDQWTLYFSHVITLSPIM